MDKEKYQALRKDNQLDLELLYEFYLEKKSPEKPTLDINNFQNLIQTHIQLVGIDSDRIWNFFDKMYV